MTLALFLAGAVLLCCLVRWWRRLSVTTLAAYLLLVCGYFAVPLCTSAFQVPTDIAYQWQPWSAVLPHAVSPGNPLLSDIPLQMLPFHHLVRERFLAGEVPLWAPELGTGQPLLGNAQSAPLAPLHLMALPLPPLRALTVAVAWQVLLALLLMHALLQALGARSESAAFGAIAYAFSLFEICWAYHPHGMAMAWIPGVLLSLVLLRRGAAGGLSGLVACSLGLVLSGHPETAANGALVALFTAGVLLARRGGAPRRLFCAKLGLAGAVTACLAAPALLPVLDAIPESMRQAVVTRHPDLVQPPPFEARMLALIVDPLRFGSPRDGTWDGPFNFNEICSGYAGLLALAAACAGAIMRPRRLLPILAAGVLALLVALRVDPFFSIMTSLPVLGGTPHARLRLLYVLAVSLAGGLGLDLIATRRGRRCVALCALLLAAALLLLPPHRLGDAPWERAWYVLALAGAAVWAGALLIARDARGLRWCAVAALLADLVVLTVRYQPIVPANLDLAPPPAIAFLQAQRQAQRQAAGGQPFRVMGELDDLKPNLGALYGLWDPRANDPMQPARASFVVGRSLRPRYEVGRQMFLVPPAYGQPVLDFLAVRFLMVRRRVHLPSPWEPVWEGPASRIWRNNAALGLFFMPRSAAATDDPARAALASADLSAVAFVAPGSPLPPRQEGRVAASRLESNGFAIDVDSAGGGLVASSVSFAKGWRGWLGNAEVEVREVNGGFLGIVVPPGRHRLHVIYEPPHWRLALWLFALGVALTVGSVARRLRRRGGARLARIQLAGDRRVLPAVHQRIEGA